MDEQDWKDKYLKLADEVRCVTESFDYKQVQGLRCKHGKWCDDECAECITEFLEEALNGQ